MLSLRILISKICVLCAISKNKFLAKISEFTVIEPRIAYVTSWHTYTAIIQNQSVYPRSLIRVLLSYFST